VDLTQKRKRAEAPRIESELRFLERYLTGRAQASSYSVRNRCGFFNVLSYFAFVACSKLQSRFYSELLRKLLERVRNGFFVCMEIYFQYKYCRVFFFFFEFNLCSEKENQFSRINFFGYQIFSKPVDFFFWSNNVMELVILVTACYLCTCCWSYQWEFQLPLPLCVFLHLFSSSHVVIYPNLSSRIRFKVVHFT
jgi:hypothetical protein